MSNRELPMMPWYPDQFAAATSTMSFAERSAYRALLDVQWAVGALPAEPWRLAQAIGMPLAEFEAAWPVVSLKFDVVEGGIRNFRLEQHRLTALRKKRGHQIGAEATNAKRPAKRPDERIAERDAERTAERSAKRHASVTPLSPSLSSKTPLPPPSGGPAVNGHGNREEGTNPRARGENPRAEAERAAQEALWEPLRKRAAACGFRAPWPVDTPDSYETSLKLHERDHPTGEQARAPGGAG